MISRVDQSLMDGLLQAQRVVKKAQIQIARLYELERTDLIIMLKLLEGPTRVQALAREANISSGAITYAVNSLIEKKMVEKKKLPSDLRVFNVILTKSGRLKSESIKHDFDAQITTVLSKIKPFDKLVLSQALSSIEI